MAADVEVRHKMCKLDENECVSLLVILKSFNAPINEEHAWALCYQCAKCFKSCLENNRGLCRVVKELDQVMLHRDGQVHASTIFAGEGISNAAGPPRIAGPPEHKVVAGLALVVFKALDFGVEEDEERHLHPDLDRLIQDMTRCEDRPSQHQAETDDEGIERDSGDCEDDPTHHTSLDQVLQYCDKHVSQPADQHYRAVCRALVAEALELSSFLDRVSQGKVRTDSVNTNNPSSGCADLQSLHLSDWARLWVQVVRELRHGVQLKKVCYSRTPIEYELTPYEILMDDIRSRRYKLNKVMVDGNIPRRVKKDAHAVILEFIRSRPPLRKASDRKLAPPTVSQASPREQLLESIKQGQAKLRPLSCPLKKKVVPFDDANQPDAVTPLKTNTRRLIKVDYSMLQMDDDDDDDELSDGGGGGERGRAQPWHRTGTSRPPALTHDEYQLYCDTALECTLPPQNACRVPVGCCIV